MPKISEVKYTLVKKPEFPTIDLVQVSIWARKFTASAELFGPNKIDTAIQKMKGPYSHPQTGKPIRFREPTTAESISLLGFYLQSRKNYHGWDFHAGRVIKTSEGIFLNPPKDDNGMLITDEKTLNSYLENITPIRIGNGKVYIAPNTKNLRDFGFAEYDSFGHGISPGRLHVNEFSKSGLARVLEHTKKEAERLINIVRKTPSLSGDIGIDEFFWEESRRRNPGPGILYFGTEKTSVPFKERLCVGILDDNISYTFGVLDTTPKRK